MCDFNFSLCIEVILILFVNSCFAFNCTLKLFYSHFMEHAMFRMHFVEQNFSLCLNYVLGVSLFYLCWFEYKYTDV